MNGFELIIIYILAVANLVSLVHFGFFLTGANWYDIQSFRRNHKAKPSLARKRGFKRYQPLVSVVVPAHNEEVGILRTVNSILESDYAKVEVIVVNDGSKDKTAAVTRKFMKTYAKEHGVHYTSVKSKADKRQTINSVTGPVKITLVNQRNAGKGDAVNNGIKNYAHGELVMTLDADSLIDVKSITNAVAYFKDEKIVGIAANVRVMGGGWIGTLQRFEHMIGYRSKKFYTVSNSEFIVGGVASTYRRSVLEQVGFYDTDTQTEDIGLSMKIIAALGNIDYRIIYAYDVVARTEGVQTYKELMKQRYRWKLGSLQNLFKYRSMMLNHRGKKYTKMLAFYRLPTAILGESLLLMEPLLMAYIIYISISQNSPIVFISAYITITLYTLWTIWPDEHMTTRQKVRMSLTAFIIYPLFYAMTLVQLTAVIRVLINNRKVYTLSMTGNTWTSPERSRTRQATV